MMILLELAGELKKAGLRHKPGDADEYWVAEVEEVMVVTGIFKPEDEDVWMPRLDQLLAEVEQRGYKWAASAYVDGYYHFQLAKFVTDDNGYVYGEDMPRRSFFDKTFEDAVAKALLWILQL